MVVVIGIITGEVVGVDVLQVVPRLLPTKPDSQRILILKLPTRDSTKRSYWRRSLKKAAANLPSLSVPHTPKPPLSLITSVAKRSRELMTITTADPDLTEVRILNIGATIQRHSGAIRVPDTMEEAEVVDIEVDVVDIEVVGAVDHSISSCSHNNHNHNSNSSIVIHTAGRGFTAIISTPRMPMT